MRSGPSAPLGGRRARPTPVKPLANIGAFEPRGTADAFLASCCGSSSDAKPSNSKPTAAAGVLRQSNMGPAAAFLTSLGDGPAKQRGATSSIPAAAAGTTVAAAYGVQRSLKLESQLDELQRQVHGAPTGVPRSGWRRSSELEQKLKGAQEEAAAVRLQAALLREESRRKGARIAQLEALLAELEKDHRAVRARLSSLDTGTAHEPLPAFAADAVDGAVGSALAASSRLLDL